MTELAVSDHTGPPTTRSVDLDGTVPDKGVTEGNEKKSTVDETPAARPGPRLAFLDGMRLLAAVAVLTHHWVGAGSARLTAKLGDVFPWHTTNPAALFTPVHTPVSYGWLGLNFFFLISGFVICLSAWGRGLGSFFTSRVSRLFPAYWFAIALTVVMVKLLPGLTGGGVRGGELNALLNFTMAQSAYKGPNVDPSYWTLWAELRFYLLFAIVVAFGLTYRRVVAFCALWTVAGLVAAATDDKLINLVVNYQFAPYFISGVAFYLIYRFGPNMLLWGIIGFNYLLALPLVQQQAISQMKQAGVAPNNIVLIVLLTLCFVILGLVALRVTDRIQWRWLTVAGALTYPLYLMHQAIGFVVIYELSAFLPPVTVLAIAFVTMLTTAWLVWRFVEKPMSRWLRNGLRNSFAALHRATPEDRTGGGLFRRRGLPAPRSADE